MMTDDQLNAEAHRLLDYFEQERDLDTYEAYRVTLRALEAMGFALSESGKEGKNDG